MRKNVLLLVLSVFITAISCVDPFSLRVITRGEILIIEGDISDQDEAQSVIIKKNIPSIGNITYAGVSGAVVEVIEDDAVPYLCKEAGNGKYDLPGGFKGKVNSDYQLRVKLPDGKEYLSTTERLNPVPEIKNVFTEFLPQGIDRNGKKIDGHFIYLDTEDIDPKENYYSWTWKHFERQYYCYSCEGGIYNRSPLPAGGCTPVANLQRLGIIYDYACDRNCWDIFNSEEVNVMSDRYANGKEINNRLIAKIPYFQEQGTLIEISQRAVTYSAFSYLNLVAGQTQNTGSLADTPPAALIGNIRNVADKYENVGGFFMVGSVRKKLVWLDRQDAKEKGGKPYGLLEGRIATLEPPNGLRPPSAFCVESYKRTGVRPRGWVD